MLLAVLVAAGVSVPGLACGGNGATHRQILFQSDRDGDWAFYAMDADGGPAHRVTRAGGGPFESSYGEPLVSPDRRKVLVAEHGLSVVFLADGSRRRLGPGEEYSASWAPDSRRVVFSGPQNRGLVIADLRGRRRRLLARNSAWSPSWSPDGRWIAYVAEDQVQEVYPVYIVHPDGRRQVRLTDYSPAGDGPLAWGPGSRRLAFIGGVQDADETNLVVVDVAERSTLALHFPITGSGPSWSPDGSRLAYVTWLAREHRSAIFTIRPDGGDRRRLAVAAPDAATPAPVWSADGRRLLFERDSPAPGGRYRELVQIWSMRADGSGKRQLTHGYPDGGANFDPAWVRGPVHAEPPRRPVEERQGDRVVLHVPFPVNGVSADGERVAVVPAAPNYEAINAPSPPLYLWRPRTGQVTRLVGSPCVSAEQVTLAAERLAFDCDQSGTDVVGQSLRVYDLASRRPTEVFFGHNGGVSTSRGVYLDRIEGGGDLLAFGSEVTDAFGRPLRRSVWRIDDGHAVRLRFGPAAGELVAAGGGRLAVELPDGGVQLRASDGRLLRVLRTPRHRPQRQFFFAPHPRRAILAGATLIVRSGRTLRVYDAESGALRNSWRVRGTLEAAEGGLAVFARGRELRFVDLRDGRSSVLRVPSDDRGVRRGHSLKQPVHADLTPMGLFYSYNVGDPGNPGRVVFVPRARLAEVTTPRAG